MGMKEEWVLIASRIAGLQEVNDSWSAHTEADSFGVTTLVRDQCLRLLDSLRDYRAAHAATLPVKVVEALDWFFACRPVQGLNAVDVNLINNRAVGGAIAVLGLLSAEVTYLLADQQASLRQRTERAFAHLQRLLVVSDPTSAEWMAAFESGEVACEKLGGTHLLGHGVYAFKARAAGSETDLVLSEPVEPGEAARISEGLVLTEWKIARSQDEVAGKFNEAFEQSVIYPTTALSGVMLRHYRYLIVVTEEPVPRTVMEAARKERDGIVYVPINIALNRIRTSQRAKTEAAATKKAGKVKS